MRTPWMSTPERSDHPLKHSARLALAAAASLALAGLVGGCDVATAKADRTVQQNVEEAQAKDPADLAKLQQAANDQGATDATKVYAKTALAQNEVAAARARLREIDEKEIRLARIVGEITTLAARIEGNNAAINGYRQRMNLAQNEAKTTLTQAAAQIQGSDSQTTWPTGEKVQGKQPTLAAAEAEIKRLQGEVATLEGQQKDLEQQRRQAENQAAELFRQADRTRGRPGVEVFTRASNQQKQATDLATQIAATEAKLLPLRQQLALAQKQQQRLAAAVEGFQKQVQQTEANAQQIQKLIDQRAALSQAVLNAPEPAAAPATQAGGGSEGGEGGAGGGGSSGFELSLPKTSLTAKAAEMNQLAQDVTAARQAVVESLQSAVKHYQEAGTVANQLYRQASESASKPGGGKDAWQAQMNAFHSSVTDLQMAQAQMLLASVWRDAATSLADRQHAAEFVQGALKSAGLQAPPGLGDPAALGQEMASAQKSAQESYDQAIETLSKIENQGSGGATARANAGRATVAHVVALYGRSLAQRLTNPQEADQSLAEARKLVAGAGEGGGGSSGGADFPLAVLEPLGLGPKPPPAPTTGPATQAAGGTGAATQPGGEGAATQPGAEGGAATQPAGGGATGQ